jgi:peptidyl-prolyl cis-trans isomerase SurA
MAASGGTPRPSSLPLDRIVAVVGNAPILWSDVMGWINERRAAGMQIPQDSAGQMALARQVTEELVDNELLVQRAKHDKIEISDADVAATADRQIKRLREQISDDAQYRDELKRAGFGTPEDYRKWLMDEARRQGARQRLIDKLRQEGKLVPASVTEAEVTEMFEKNKATLPRRQSTVTFRQIVIAPRGSPAAREAARVKAESLLAEIKRGGDFIQIAKRESMDQTTRETGGDLGWNRRGLMVRDFDQVMFSLQPGQTSDVFETIFGYHIVRVDRVQPAEVKARHILIRPVLDSNDVARARMQADSVYTAWKNGASFDTLLARYNDPREYALITDPVERDKLPQSYATAFSGKLDGEIVPPFPIEDKSVGVPKFVVAQITKAVEGGDFTVADLRETIREQIAQEKSMRRLLQQLRKETYVSVRL